MTQWNVVPPPKSFIRKLTWWQAVTLKDDPNLSQYTASHLRTPPWKPHKKMFSSQVIRGRSKSFTVKRPKMEDETIANYKVGERKTGLLKTVNLLHLVLRAWFTYRPTNFEHGWGDKRVLSNDAVNCRDYIASMADDRSMSMEHGWNYTYRREWEVLGKSPIPVHFVHKKSHRDPTESIIFAVKWGCPVACFKKHVSHSIVHLHSSCW